MHTAPTCSRPCCCPRSTKRSQVLRSGRVAVRPVSASSWSCTGTHANQIILFTLDKPVGSQQSSRGLAGWRCALPPPPRGPGQAGGRGVATKRWGRGGGLKLHALHTAWSVLRTVPRGKSAAHNPALSRTHSSLASARTGSLPCTNPLFRKTLPSRIPPPGGGAPARRARSPGRRCVSSTHCKPSTMHRAPVLFWWELRPPFPYRQEAGHLRGEHEALGGNALQHPVQPALGVEGENLPGRQGA